MHPIGTRVANQAEPRIEGTVIGPVPGLPDWSLVLWDTGESFDEDDADVTPLEVAR